MNNFEIGQRVRLKSWEELEPIKNDFPSINEEMYEQCQGEFITDEINESGYFVFKVNDRKTWTIAPWMCNAVIETQEPRATLYSFDDILNGVN